MTFKDLSKKLKASVQTLPNLINVLADAFDEIDGGSDGGDTNYSAKEHVIGKWIDGSVLYEKTIDAGMLPNATSKTVNYDANLDVIVNIFGIGIASNGACPIPFVDDSYATGNILLDANTSTGTIRLISQSDKSSYHGYITMQYTKTRV